MINCLLDSSVPSHQLLHGGWDDPIVEDLGRFDLLGEKEASLCRYESHVPRASGTVGLTECCPLSDHEC